MEVFARCEVSLLYGIHCGQEIVLVSIIPPITDWIIKQRKNVASQQVAFLHLTKTLSKGLKSFGLNFLIGTLNLLQSLCSLDGKITHSPSGLNVPSL